MFNKKGTIYFMIVALVVLLVLVSCDARKGTLTANLQPYVSITNYFGADSDSLITESFLFQQTVQWSGTDEDGVVEGYAFRVLNENEEPIATPGHDVIDEDGWVKFYTPNANLNIPLNESAETTIWEDQSYATVNFPAADANGDSANVISIFEVKCIDNSGNESEVARKFFQAHSHTPSIFANSTKGDIDGETISTAIVFEFMMLDNDPFVGSLPYYYMYKLERRDLDNNVIPENEGGYTDEWISTLGYNDISQSLHSALNGNALIPNELDTGVPQDSTFLVAKAIDSALIQSESIEISFIVKEGFSPGTVIYFGEGNSNANAIYGLGTNHFATYLDDGIADILPSVMTSDGAHHATAFWFNELEEYAAIGSEDFKTYMRWGYSGEFEENNPFKKRNDETLDEATGQSYYCEIVGYDIRLDGAPYYYPPIPAEGNNLQVDDDGTQWLRVGYNDPIGQSTTVTLTSFGGTLDDMYGEHVFEVRAIDLQGVVDSTPHEFHFTVYQPVPKAQKSGVLIIDDEGDTAEAPAAYIDSLYNYYVSDFDPNSGYINREEKNALIIENGMDGLHYGKSIIAPSDIQQFNAIIYHADNPTAEFNLWKEFEALKIYLLQGGNLIVSSGSKVKIVNQKCAENAFNIFEEYFGIPMDNSDIISWVSTSYTVNPFFVTAIAENGYNDLDLMLPSFNNSISNPIPQLDPILSVNGLGPVAFFNDGHDAEVIFSYGSKPVADDPPGHQYHINPTQAEYDQYNGVSIGLRRVTEDNSCFIFGFPFAYMNAEDVKTMLNQILNELP